MGLARIDHLHRHPQLAQRPRASQPDSVPVFQNDPLGANLLYEMLCVLPGVTYRE